MRNYAMVFGVLAGALLLPSAGYADDSDARVARVSYVSGEVSYQRGDVEGWNGLRVNTPLVTGDSFYAPEGGRAEVDLGSGIVIRVDGGTQVDLVNNTRDIAQLGLTSGSLDLRARSFSPNFTLEIDTPSGAATLLEPGRYRVDVNDRMATYATVQGSMSLAIDGQQLDVLEGESLELEYDDPPTYSYGRLAARTPFHSWADDRDSRFERSPSARYVNADVVGYEDLDDHGSWRDSRGYGRVWVPSGMSRDWAPYQSGRWIWQDPYGWTWVSNESWGWAPYHYGRWVWADDTWGWVPPPPRGYRGPSVVMSIGATYSPALVAFVGGRNWGLSLSIGGPAIGWVPLAPAERYYYPWQSAPRVTNNYTNITVNNAVTIVNYNTFATDTVRPIRVEQTQIQRAPVMGFAPVGVVPTRASLVVSSGGNERPKAIPRERTERPLVARLVPPPRPQQFAAKVVEIEKTGRPVARPVAIEGTVGKPFVRGAQAPAGIKAVSALAPEGRKELKPRGNAEIRAPKKIERDIAPPTPAAGRGRQERVQPVPPEARDRRVPGRPDAGPVQEARPVPPEPQPAPPTEMRDRRAPGKPDAKPAQGARQVPPEPQPAPPTEMRDRRAPGRPDAGPAQAARPVPPEPQPAPPTEMRDRRAPGKPDAKPAQGARQVPPEPQQAPPPEPENRRAPGRPEARPMEGARQIPPEPQPAPPQEMRDRRAPGKPDAKPAQGARQVPPEPQPAPPPEEAKKAPAPGKDQAKPPQDVPKKKKKSKDKNVPVPAPPEPAPGTSQGDGK